jgi:acetyltransferase-like isoleucine patch superfamily enzyme
LPGNFEMKHALLFLCRLLVLPLWLAYRLEALLLTREKAFYGYSQLLCLFPGIVGNYVRFAFYRMTIASLGDGACICFGATFAHPGIRIGRGVYIGPWCNLGLCTVEDDVLFGSDVHVISGFNQHGHEDLSVPVREQRGELLNVRIGRDSWIGNKAVVGNHVGEKSIVGAAALVVREVPPYSVAVGNPAEVVRDRRSAGKSSI